MDDTTLDWENFLPALMLSYNTSYHSTIATTPFELLFGNKPRLPSFPNPDIQRLHYGDLQLQSVTNFFKKFVSWLKTLLTIMALKSKTSLIKQLFRTILPLMT